jgi:hypothetical protein
VLLPSVLLLTAHTEVIAADTIPIQPANRTGAEPGPPGGRYAGLEQQPDRPLSGLNSEAAFGRLFIWRHQSEGLSALGGDISSREGLRMLACRAHPHAGTTGVRKAPRHEIAGTDTAAGAMEIWRRRERLGRLIRRWRSMSVARGRPEGDGRRSK